MFWNVVLCLWYNENKKVTSFSIAFCLKLASYYFALMNYHSTYSLELHFEIKFQEDLPAVLFISVSFNNCWPLSNNLFAMT